MSLSINGVFNSFKSFATESFEAAKEQAGFVAKSTAEAAEEVLIKDPVEFFTGKKDATPKDAAILYAAATVPYLTVPFGCGGADATDKCGGDQTGIKLNGRITYAYVNADGTLSPIDNKYQIIGNRTIRISINAEDCSGASDGLNAIFTINGNDYKATRSGSIFYVEYPCQKMEEIKGTITLVDPDFDPDVRRTENIDGAAGSPIENVEYTIIDATNNKDYIIARRPITLEAGYTLIEGFPAEGISIEWIISPSSFTANQSDIDTILGDTSWQTYFIPISNNKLSFTAETVSAINASDIDEEKKQALTQLLEAIIQSAQPEIVLYPLYPKKATFTPMIAGTYDITLKITLPSTTEPLLRSLKSIVVNPFSSTPASITGNRDPQAGSNGIYSASLPPLPEPPNGRGQGAEDVNATCVWHMEHIDPITGQIVVDDLSPETSGVETNDQAQGCNGALTFAFPANISTETRYRLSLTVMGEDDSYVTAAPIHEITVHPATSSVNPRFDVITPYDGRITHRPIQFAANPIAEASKIVWTLVAKDYQPLETPEPLGEGTTIAHNFNEPGVYTIKVSYQNEEGKEIDSYVNNSSPYDSVFRVEAFPIPPVSVNINDNKAAHAGDEVFFAADILREWPEDDAATYSWRVVYTHPDPADTAQTVQDDITGTPLCTDANAPVVRCTVPYEGKLNYYLTISGNGENEAYIYEASDQVDVWPVSTGGDGQNPPSLAINGPYAGHLGDTITLSANSNAADDGEYLWTVTPPVGQIYTVPGRELTILPEALLVGDWDISMTVTKDGISTTKSHPISIYDQAAAIPSAVIGDELQYSYELGGVATNITGHSDDPGATYHWDVTRPDGRIDIFDGVIASYEFDLLGDYDFKLTVTAADGRTTNQEIRSVGVYASSAEIPRAGMVIPDHAVFGEPADFIAVDPDFDKFNYSWDFGNGETHQLVAGEGTYSYAYPAINRGQIATYPVSLTVEDKTSGAKTSSTQNLVVVSPAVQIPAYQLMVPDYAPVGSEVQMSLNFPLDADPNGWNVEWFFGDGGTLSSPVNQPVSYIYNETGIYAVTYRLSNEALGLVIEPPVASRIQIGSPASPTVSLSFPETGNQGRTPFNARLAIFAQTADGENENFTYNINWGEANGQGNIVDGASSDVRHTYFSAGTYTVTVTVNQQLPNGDVVTTPPIQTTVVTWGQ